LTGNVCPECGIDVVIFEKTLKISDVLYNKGLGLARIRDLSGSIDSLTKSIQFNKNNYYARNLLGLVYFEVGKLGDALKQWVISASLVKRDNPAIKYIEEIQSEPTLLDDYNDAIVMYNNALLYIQQKSDDLAIIQLKKALEISPGFIDAMNLLTFCYMIKSEREMASILVERTLDLDINNPVSLNYYKELYPGRKRIALKEPKEQPRPLTPGLSSGKLAMDDRTRRNLFGNNFFLAEAAAFVIGGLCALALLYFAYIPGLVSDKNQELIGLKAQINQLQSDSDLAESSSASEIARLEREKTELQNEVKRINSLMLAENKSQQVDLAATEFNNANFIEAAKIIREIEPTGLDDSTLSRYRELKESSYRSAAADLYNQGVKHWDEESNAEAKLAFETCMIYAPEDVEYIDDIYYYFGSLAERANNKELALEHYKYVVENYPQSNKLSAANAKIAELGN